MNIFSCKLVIKSGFSHRLTEYDKPLVRQLIEKVTVHEDKLTLEFKPVVTAAE